MERYRPTERNELLERRYVLLAQFHTATDKLDQVERVAKARNRPSRLAHTLRLERDRLGWEIEDVDARLSQLTNEPKEHTMTDESGMPQVSLPLDVAVAIYGAAKLTYEAMREGEQEGQTEMAEIAAHLQPGLEMFSGEIAKAITETGPGKVLVDVLMKMGRVTGKDTPPPPTSENPPVPGPTPSGQEQRSPKAARILERAIETDAEPDEDLLGKTDCPELCEVEPDGKCPHGYLSAGRSAGVV